MSIFQHIDVKLINLSNTIGAKLTMDRPEYPDVLSTFEERRIDWIEDGINKAIIIQPNFELHRINNEIWNFILFAWCDDSKSVDIPRWIEMLVFKKDFSIIESQIDKLLDEAIFRLQTIKMSDLK